MRPFRARISARTSPISPRTSPISCRRSARRSRRIHSNAPTTASGPDVARLTDHYWKDIAAAAGSRATLARETVTALAAHPWPGNVRELQNVLANLTVTGPRYGPVGPDALPSTFRKTAASERRPYAFVASI